MLVNDGEFYPHFLDWENSDKVSSAVETNDIVV